MRVNSRHVGGGEGENKTITLVSGVARKPLALGLGRFDMRAVLSSTLTKAKFDLSQVRSLSNKVIPIDTIGATSVIRS